jgi:hypothetical protein
MKARTAFRLAWSVWLATAVFLAGAVVLAISRHAPLGLTDLSLVFVFLCFATVGAVIAARRGRNAVGWLCSAIALAAILGQFASEYGNYAVTHPGSLPAANVVAWFAVWTWFATLGLLSTFLLLLFPSGHLPSPRWRPVAWAAGATLGTICLAAATTSYPPEVGMLSNPLAVERLAWAQELVWAVGLPALGVLVLASAVSLIARFRQARGEERQQLKWFTYAAALLALLTTPGAVSPTLDNRIPDSVHNASLAAIPIAIGIAILRYRLYDIDRIINRTLVYGLLTTLLGGVYAAMVLVLGQVFGGVGGDPPSWAVAGATLAVAALFQPARHRIQGVVDRRFNRRKYDATKTVEAFTTRLRDEVDLDTLSAELLAVANQTMQPTVAWLWLRPSTERMQRIGT